MIKDCAAYHIEGNSFDLLCWKVYYVMNHPFWWNRKSYEIFDHEIKRAIHYLTINTLINV